MAQCIYYQATIPERKNHLFVVGLLKYYDNLCFDRTVDGSLGLFEFYVPSSMHYQFLSVMNILIESEVIKNFHKMPNPIAVAT